MKRKLRYLSISATVLLLCAVFFAGSMLQAYAQTDAKDAMDFGIKGTESNQTVLPSVLFEEFFREPPTAVEKDYLDGLSGLSLVYNSAIPDSIVTTDYNGDTSVLDVSLPSYSYVATNGVTVEWIPQSANVDGNEQTFAFSNGIYSCHFEGMFHSGDFEMEIDFSWTATVPAVSADALLTAPYTAGNEALTELKAYEAKLTEYNAAKAKYLAYEAYLQSVEDYEQYVNVDLPAYEAAVEAYKPYLAYLEKLAAYEEWQHYWDYQEFMSSDVQTKYLAYQAYLKELEPIKSRLNALEALFIRDSRGWQLYSSLMGGTVDQVLAKKDLLIQYNSGFKTHINNADQATRILKELMQTYSNLRNAKYDSDHARLTALYAFYTANYSTLKTQFKNLYEALNYMGSDVLAVQSALIEKGQLEHYFQFVGQLYITQACLDDAVTMDKSAPICATLLLSEAVQPSQIVTDGKANPNGVKMPATEVPKVEKVEPIDRPTVERVDLEPTLADFGLTKIPPEPIEPEVVAKPADTAPDYAEDPGEAPDAPVMDARLRDLAEAVRAGTLPKRTAQGKSHTLTFTETVTCPVSILNRKTVTFYSADGKEVLYQNTYEYGEKVVYKGPDTARASDAQYHYEFLGWVLLPEKTPAEMVANSNLSLYAYYRETPRFYTVTWILDGAIREMRAQYGATPVSPFVTQRSPDKAYTYEFSGWDQEIAAVTADVTYTASFIRIPRSYEITWIVGDGSVTQSLAYGTEPVYDGDTSKAPDSYRYEFLRWDQTPTAVSGDATYTAEYRKTPLAFDENGTVLTVTHSDTAVTVFAVGNRADVREAARLAQETGKALEICWESFSVTVQNADLSLLTDSFCRQVGVAVTPTESGSDYVLGYLNSSGRLLDTAVPATLEMRTNATGGQPHGYLADGDAWVYMEDGKTDIVGSVTLRVRDVFGLEIVSDEPCNIAKFPRFFEAGAIVDLSQIGCEFGYEISAATLVMADGSRVAVDGLTFAMPNAAAKVELTVTKIVYRVVFRVDGEMIHSAEYGYFEKIEAPADPTKDADENYTYAFAGWSPEVDLAYGNAREMVFEATFTPTPIGATFVPDQSLLRTVLIIAIIAVVVLTVAIITIVILVRRRKRIKKADVVKRSIASKKAAIQKATLETPVLKTVNTAETVDPTETSEAAETVEETISVSEETEKAPEEVSETEQDAEVSESAEEEEILK